MKNFQKEMKSISQRLENVKNSRLKDGKMKTIGMRSTIF
jgi:hypothetical protein